MRTQGPPLGAGEPMELRKWQAPEVLSKRAFSHSSDVWVSSASTSTHLIHTHRSGPKSGNTQEGKRSFSPLNGGKKTKTKLSSKYVVFHHAYLFILENQNWSTHFNFCSVIYIYIYSIESVGDKCPTNVWHHMGLKQKLHPLVRNLVLTLYLSNHNIDWTDIHLFLLTGGPLVSCFMKWSHLVSVYFPVKMYRFSKETWHLAL